MAQEPPTIPSLLQAYCDRLSCWRSPLFRLQPAGEQELRPRMCETLHEFFESLKSVIFWIQISERDLKRTIRNPEKQEWLQAFNSFSAYKVEVEISIIDPEAAKVLWCTCTSHNRSRVWWPTGSWEQKWWREKEMLKQLVKSGFHGLTDDLEDDMRLETLFKTEESTGN
jgi:hypothetical protein